MPRTAAAIPDRAFLGACTELPFRSFDTPRVDASPEAFQLRGMPDALRQVR